MSLDEIVTIVGFWEPWNLQTATVKLVLCFDGACLGHLQKPLNLSRKQMNHVKYEIWTANQHITNSWRVERSWCHSTKSLRLLDFGSLGTCSQTATVKLVLCCALMMLVLGTFKKLWILAENEWCEMWDMNCKLNYNQQLESWKNLMSLNEIVPIVGILGTLELAHKLQLSNSCCALMVLSWAPSKSIES